MGIVCKGMIEKSLTLLEDGRRRVRQNHLFFCDSAEGMTELLKNQDFPGLGSALPDLPDLKCSSVRILPKRDGKQNRIEVECEYEDVQYQGSIHIGGSDTGKAFRVSVRSLETRVPFEFAYNPASPGESFPSLPVTASSGVPIEADTVRISVLLRFSYFRQNFNPGLLLTLPDTVNASAVTVCGITIPAGQGLIRSLTSELATLSDGEQYSRITAEVELDPAGFIRKFPDRSLWCLGSNGKPARIFSSLDSTHKPLLGDYYTVNSLRDPECSITAIDEPVWLNADGSVASSQSGASFTPRMLSFREKRSASWSALHFPAQADW